MDECFTTIWQPKALPSAGFTVTLPSAEALSTPSYICQVFDVLVANAGVAGRHVVRVLDLDTFSLVGKAVVDSLVSTPSNQVLVDYFLTGAPPEDADEKARAMSYPRARPFILDTNSAVSPKDGDVKIRVMSDSRPFNLDPTQTNSGVPPQDTEAIARAMLDPKSGENVIVFGGQLVRYSLCCYITDDIYEYQASISCSS